MNQGLRRKSARGGFTFIEILVCVSIMTVLIALLLPAVSAAREASRRASCLNNLRQIGIALLGYESAHCVFPPGCVNETAPVLTLPMGFQHGWVVQVLPYLEQRPMAAALNLMLGVHHPAQSTTRSLQISILLCPSDTDPPVFQGAALSNYAGCHHDAEAPIMPNQNGLLMLNRCYGFRDIPDGASYTMIVGEKLRDPDYGWMSGTRATLRNMGDLPAGLASSEVGPPIPEFFGVGTFESKHPGGTNGLNADGSIRFVRGGSQDGNRHDGEF